MPQSRYLDDDHGADSTERRLDRAVEDDVTLGAAFAQVLRAAGYDVWLTTSADEALESIKIVLPSAIVVDFRMPPINGLKQQLGELGAELRVKPIRPNELLDLVKGMLGGPTAPQKQRTVLRRLR